MDGQLWRVHGHPGAVQYVCVRNARPHGAIRRIVTDLLRILWPLAVIYAVHRLCETASLFAPVRETEQVEEDPYDATVPEDLIAVAMQYPDAWAQEDMVKAIREKYDALRDWNLVRAAFGVGRVDA
jgi:hypothetical protein